DERDAGAVQVDERDLRAGLVNVLPRILLEVDARQANVADLSALAERLVVLGDLIALGEGRVKVVLAREARARAEGGADGEAEAHREIDGTLVQDRQRAGKAEDRRVGLAVRLAAESRRRGGEELRRRRELDVALEADDRLPRHGATSGCLACQSVSLWYAP